jgi:hypothetical protein
MIPGINFSEDEWASPGPGSARCLQHIFGPDVRGHEVAAMRYLVSVQDEHWKRIGYTPKLAPDFHRTGVSIVDMEHALCEVDKYSRAALPWIKTTQKGDLRAFKSDPSGDRPPIVAVHLPPKWQGGKTGLENIPSREDLEKLQALHDDDIYEVSHVVAASQTQYRIRWLNWPPEEDQWMSKAELKDTAPALAHDWEMMVSNFQYALDVASNLHI